MSIVVDIQTISIAVASASVVAGVVYYALQIKHQGKTRHTDMIMRLYSHSGSKEMVEAIHKVLMAEYKDYDDFVKRYGPIISKDPVSIAIGMVISFYEGIGILVHRKLVDVDIVMELFVANAIWEKIRPVIEGARKHYDIPSLCEWFEYLYNEMKKREQKLQQSKT